MPDYTTPTPAVKQVKLSSPETPSILRRQALAERDGWLCHYCLCDLTDYGRDEQYQVNYLHTYKGQTKAVAHVVLPDGVRYATIDHKVPKSKGGTEDASNLVLACMKCNGEKNSRVPYGEFFLHKRTGNADLYRRTSLDFTFRLQDGTKITVHKSGRFNKPEQDAMAAEFMSRFAGEVAK